MIIKIIIYFCKFNFINSFMNKLSNKYQAQLPTEKEVHQIAQDVCKENLLRIAEYERIGPKSGLPAPKIYHLPGKGA